MVVDHSRVSIATTLPGSGIIPSAKIRWLNNFISDLANSHFSTLIFNPAYFSWPRTQSKCLTCFAILLEYIITSSKYTITNSSKWLCKTWFISCWKVAEALHNSKGILKYSYCFHMITKAVLSISSFHTLTCQYLATISIIV